MDLLKPYIALHLGNVRCARPTTIQHHKTPHKPTSGRIWRCAPQRRPPGQQHRNLSQQMTTYRNMEKKLRPGAAGAAGAAGPAGVPTRESRSRSERRARKPSGRQSALPSRAHSRLRRHGRQPHDLEAPGRRGDLGLGSSDLRLDLGDGGGQPRLALGARTISAPRAVMASQGAKLARQHRFQVRQILKLPRLVSKSGQMLVCQSVQSSRSHTRMDRSSPCHILPFILPYMGQIQ